MVLSNNQRGFTMVELLIGLLAASVITYAALSLYLTQHKQLLVQDEISDMQANVRASAEMMAKAIRNAGYNIPNGAAIETHDSNPDTIVVNFDSGVLQNVQLSEGMPQPSTELKCAGSDLSGLNEGDWVYIYDRATDTGEFLLVTAVQDSDYIQHNTMSLSRVYPAGSRVIKMNRIRFFIDQADSTHPNLMIQTYGNNPQTLAENIIGLDFRYFLANGAMVTQTSNPGQIRMVEIDVLGRTSSPDPEFFENYRTRNFSLRVKVRNLEFN
jgi:prepilin-type N-terminal cleavage/methylation domain-containing protein